MSSKNGKAFGLKFLDYGELYAFKQFRCLVLFDNHFF